MSKAQKVVERYRDARTGHYVTKEYAEENPDTTVKETLVLKVPKVKPPRPQKEKPPKLKPEKGTPPIPPVPDVPEVPDEDIAPWKTMRSPRRLGRGA
jgi:hypothetical protein